MTWLDHVTDIFNFPLKEVTFVDLQYHACLLDGREISISLQRDVYGLLHVGADDDVVALEN